MNLLSLSILIPFLGGFSLLFFDLKEVQIKSYALFVSLITFVLSIFLWISFDSTIGKFQFLIYSPFCWLGLDGISLLFVLLVTFLIPICLLASWVVKKQVKLYFSGFLILEGLLILVFSVLDLFIFYVFFEAVLIPMFFLIGSWGSRGRKIRAAYLFFMYTLLGSVFLLLALIVIYLESGTLNYLLLLNSSMTFEREYVLWLSFFVSFAVKLPLLPVHLWLPEAHVEAPTAGSVLLAGVLLKLGSYGLIRFSIPLFPEASLFFNPLVYSFCLLGVIYSSLSAVRQSDIKRIIAYASVAHMNLILLGLFSQVSQGVEGSVLQMLSHGLVSGGLFLCVGIIYDRYHTRLVKYYSGLVHFMPSFCVIFVFFTLGNIALPGTSSFVGEFLILLGVYKFNTLVAFLGSLSMVFGGVYSLWLLNRIMFGNLKIQYLCIESDINRREVAFFLPLVFLVLFIGINPSLFLDVLHFSCESLII